MKIGTANGGRRLFEWRNLHRVGLTQTFLYPTRYYYHKFTVRSQQYDIQFNQSTVMGVVGQVKLECIFTLRSQPITYKSFTDGKSKRLIILRQQKNPASKSNSDGTWIEPTLHNSDGTWPSSTYVNYSPSSTYNYTYGYYDDTNVNNVARLSYQLSRYKRYKLKVYTITDNTFPDMRVFIRAGTEDSGASFDTEYTLTIT